MKRTSIIAALVLSAVSSTIAQQQSARTRDAFELVSAKAFPSGIIFTTYKVAGSLKTG
jgi:hypothetical protein